MIFLFDERGGLLVKEVPNILELNAISRTTGSKEERVGAFSSCLLCPPRSVRGRSGVEVEVSSAVSRGPGALLLRPQTPRLGRTGCRGQPSH